MTPPHLFPEPPVDVRAGKSQGAYANATGVRGWRLRDEECSSLPRSVQLFPRSSRIPRGRLGVSEQVRDFDAETGCQCVRAWFERLLEPRLQQASRSEASTAVPSLGRAGYGRKDVASVLRGATREATSFTRSPLRRISGAPCHAEDSVGRSQSGAGAPVVPSWTRRRTRPSSRAKTRRTLNRSFQPSRRTDTPRSPATSKARGLRFRSLRRRSDDQGVVEALFAIAARHMRRRGEVRRLRRG